MTAAREFTEEGIEAARRVLSLVRAQPRRSVVPLLDDLLFRAPYTRPFTDAPDVEPRAFATRAEAAAYLEARLRPIQHRIGDNAGFWSWLGMFYFEHTVRRDGEGLPRLSPLDETFVVYPGERRSYQRRYRHYLWSAWRLQQQHGPHAGFLLGAATPRLRRYRGPRILLSSHLQLGRDRAANPRAVYRRGWAEAELRPLARRSAALDPRPRSTRTDV